MVVKLGYDNYVVYHRESTRIHARYKSAGWARRLVKKLGKNYAYCEESRYRNQVVHVKTVINLMSKKPVEIPSDTPLCCDPSSETYWSM